MISYRQELFEKLNEYRGRKLYLYGASDIGNAAYQLFSYYGLDIAGYLVTEGSGQLNGLPVQSIESVDLQDIRNGKLILTLSHNYYGEVKELLHSKEIYDIDDSFDMTKDYFYSEIYSDILKKHNIDTNQKILTLGNVKLPNPFVYQQMSPFWAEFGDILLPCLFQDQRFICEGMYEYNLVKLESDDIVLDCGANIGLFSSYAASQNCYVYAFEPLVEQLGNILNMCSRLNSNRICHIPYALSDHEGSAEFNISHSTENSSLLSGVLSKYKKKILENVVNVNITTVDSFVQSNNLSRVDFIKADIEGSERQMLKGATQVLREFAPKLAICTYHYPDDPQVLEGIIKAANPQYKVIHKWKKLFAYV